MSGTAATSSRTDRPGERQCQKDDDEGDGCPPSALGQDDGGEGKDCAEAESTRGGGGCIRVAVLVELLQPAAAPSPGRFVWIFFAVGISLILMEVNVFKFLNTVLGFYSNVAIAWIGAITADLVINKPVGWSPPGIEFKRAHLRNFNPVGFGSMLVASLVSILCYFEVIGGETAKAYSPFVALAIGFGLSPLVALATKGKYYTARVDQMPNPLWDGDNLSAATHQCVVCQETFERPDVAYCPFDQHTGTICSLCCSVDSACHDACKKGGGIGPVDLTMPKPRITA